MGLRRSVDSTSELISLQDLKNHLRIDHDDDNALLEGIRKGARKWAENYCQRSFFTQTWVLELDHFPDTDCIELLMSPIQSVSSIKYYDSSDVQQTWSSSEYRVDANSQIGRIQPVNDWPNVYEKQNAVEITYVAGNTSLSDIPDYVKTGVMIQCGDMYELRQNVVIGSQINVRNTTELLLDSYKVYYAYQ